MAKKKTEYELLAKRIELLEMQVKELTTVEPEVINERLKSIEETLYTTKDILNMKEVCQYLDISQSLLYKLTCSGEIPHFKPRGKMIFFEKKELIEWIKKSNLLSSEITKVLLKQYLIITLIMKKTKKNSIDGVNLPDSRLVELLDRCAISVKDVRTDIKKNKQNGKKN